MNYENEHICAECDKEIKDCTCYAHEGFGPDEDAFDFVETFDEDDADEIPNDEDDLE